MQRIILHIVTIAHTFRIPGAGKNLNLQSVQVNGHTIRLAEFATSTMYGHGVAIRFLQQGSFFFARAVALYGHPLVTLIYRIS